MELLNLINFFRPLQILQVIGFLLMDPPGTRLVKGPPFGVHVCGNKKGRWKFDTKKRHFQQQTHL